MKARMMRIAALLIVAGVVAVCTSFAGADDLGSQLLVSAAKGDLKTINEVLANGADVNYAGKDGVTALMWASLSGHLGVIELLLSKGAKVNATSMDGTTALMWACRSANKEIVKLLLRKGADPKIRDKQGRTALSMASQQGHPEIVEILKTSSAEARPAAQTPGLGMSSPLDSKLIQASYSGDIETVKTLIDNGANIEAVDESNHATPLLWAAFGGRAEAARLLLAKGANVNAKSDGDLTPLLAACAGSHLPVATLLLEKGAHVDVKSTDGLTPFSIASQKSDKEMLNLLIGHCSRLHWGLCAVQRVDSPKGCLSVRKEPSKSSPEVGCVKRGEMVRLNGLWSDSNWAAIYEPVAGWVNAAQIDTRSLPPEKRAIFALGASVDKPPHVEHQSGSSRRPDPEPVDESATVPEEVQQQPGLPSAPRR